MAPDLPYGAEKTPPLGTQRVKGNSVHLDFSKERHLQPFNGLNKLMRSNQDVFVQSIFELEIPFHDLRRPNHTFKTMRRIRPWRNSVVKIQTASTRIPP